MRARARLEESAADDVGFRLLDFWTSGLWGLGPEDFGMEI